MSLKEDLKPANAAKAYVALAVSVVLASLVVFVDVGGDGMTTTEWGLLVLAALNPLLVWAKGNSNSE